MAFLKLACSVQPATLGIIQTKTNETWKSQIHSVQMKPLRILNIAKLDGEKQVCQTDARTGYRLPSNPKPFP